jgi:hypothetical protein
MVMGEINLGGGERFELHGHSQGLMVNLSFDACNVFFRFAH